MFQILGVKKSQIVSTTSGLMGHTQICLSLTKQTQVLGDFGIIGGSTSCLTPEQVHESFALWTAESMWPFCIVNNRHLQRLLRPNAHTHQPHCITISKEIQRIYWATQTDINKVLVSGNGDDFLGIVIFCPIVLSSLSSPRTIAIKRFVLECLSYNEEHTGVELAKTLHAVFVKFMTEDWVWGVVSNNVLNNGVMMNELAMYGLKQLTGPKAWPITAPFCAKQCAMVKEHGGGDSDKEDKPEGSVPAEHNMQEASDLDNGLDPSIMLHVDSNKPDAEDDEDTVEIDLPKMVSRLAHRLHFTPKAWAIFQVICVAKEVPTPHNIKRDNLTCWNSSEDMLEGCDQTWDAIIEFQLLTVTTKTLSRAGIPMLGDVVVHHDRLEYKYREMCLNKKLPLWMRQAAFCTCRVLNK
ncbi:hypothetical protein BDV93DRAFT_515772 [Ceratobasidium sp. AG-I]|nr:hypothetical protein BDV93DRAFT_515772 [Ceratobasidium sp. AG-I]